MSEENAKKDSIPVLINQDNLDNNDLQLRPLMLEDLKFETLNVSNGYGFLMIINFLFNKKYKCYR